MRSGDCRWLGVLSLFAGLLTAGGLSLGCGGGAVGRLTNLFGTPFLQSTTGTGGTTGPGGSSTSSGSGGTGGTTTTDPCDVSQSQKFVRISMRNISDSYIHYFVLFIARVNGDTYPDGAVCPTDQALYTAFGYTFVPDGQFREFGSFCLVGPALYYLHRGGQFQGAGTQGLASGIGPAQGTTATYDSFFGANGAQIPVPEQIVFHNPGTTAEGQALKVSSGINSPCSILITVNTTACLEDAFYYVDENDLRDGTNVRGSGSYVRVPSDIQGTGCQCGLGSDSSQRLAPLGTLTANAACDEYFRGGRIDYVFLRDDQEPPIPQLVWRVSDSTGSRIHDFDARAQIP